MTLRSRSSIITPLLPKNKTNALISKIEALCDSILPQRRRKLSPFHLKQANYTNSHARIIEHPFVSIYRYTTPFKALTPPCSPLSLFLPFAPFGPFCHRTHERRLPTRTPSKRYFTNINIQTRHCESWWGTHHGRDDYTGGR